jgi:hypothetical protein
MVVQLILSIGLAAISATLFTVVHFMKKQQEG